MGAAQDHGEREHAPFSPSASDRWLACPASVRMEEGMPDGDSRATIAGTICHEVAEDYLRNWKDPFNGSHPVAKEGVTKDGERFRVVQTAEQWKFHVIPYVEKIRSIYRAYQEAAAAFGMPLPTMLIEEKVDIEGKDCFGTIDCAIIMSCGKEIWCIDLKAGSGHMVPATAPQFKTYMLGLIKKYVPKGEEGDWRYFVGIGQAADDPKWKEHEWKWPDLKKHRAAIRKAIKAHKDAAPGPAGDHCLWCKAKGKCGAQRDRALAALETDVDATIEVTPPDPGTMTKAQRVFIIENAKQIREWVDAVEAVAQQEMFDGEEYPGLKVVRGRANRRWKSDIDTEDIANDLRMLGIDEPYDKKLISFTKAEKMIDKALIAQLVEKPDGKLTVVPASDKRAPVSRLEVLDG